MLRMASKMGVSLVWHPATVGEYLFALSACKLLRAAQRTDVTKLDPAWGLSHEVAVEW